MMHTTLMLLEAAQNFEYQYVDLVAPGIFEFFRHEGTLSQREIQQGHTER